MRQTSDLTEVNITGTYHVLEAARRTGVDRVVYASSNRVTGFYDIDTLVDEHAPRPDGFYGVSKVAGEALCRLYSDKFDLSTIVIRIGSYERCQGPCGKCALGSALTTRSEPSRLR